MRYRNTISMKFYSFLMDFFFILVIPFLTPEFLFFFLIISILLFLFSIYWDVVITLSFALLSMVFFSSFNVFIITVLKSLTSGPFQRQFLFSAFFPLYGWHFSCFFECLVIFCWKLDSLDPIFWQLWVPSHPQAFVVLFSYVVSDWTGPFLCNVFLLQCAASAIFQRMLPWAGIQSSGVVLAGLPFWVCLFLDLSLKLLACLPLYISPQQLASTNFWLIALLFSTMSWVTNFFTFLFRPFFRSNIGAQALSLVLTPGGLFLCLFPPFFLLNF